MIAQLTGLLVHKSPACAVIDVGGVGYSITTSLTTFAALPEEGRTVTVMIHTYVREDTLALYGFVSAEERRLFGRLISVSGVGPKVAMAILSGIPPDRLITAITSGDRERLNAIPGVGRKTAERIIVDLKDKLAHEQFPEGPRSAATPMPLFDDALSALTNLGYSRPMAERALAKLDWSSTMPLEAAIRAALKELMPS